MWKSACVGVYQLLQNQNLYEGSNLAVDMSVAIPALATTSYINVSKTVMSGSTHRYLFTVQMSSWLLPA